MFTIFAANIINRLMKRFMLLVLPLGLLSCGSKSVATETQQVVTDSVEVVEDSIFSPRYVYEIPLPNGYERKLVDDSTSFAYYLQHLTLKPQGTPVMYYWGEESGLTSVSYAVIDGFDLGGKDLMQCADFIIRLRAEWLYNQQRYNEIAFHFTNGWLCDYKHWAEGDRVVVKGNNTSWYHTNKGVDYSYNTFRTYLDMVFNYAGTLSLSKELESINRFSIEVGDVFISGGSPGHAVIVLDIAKSTNPNVGANKLFIVAEGFMPAQDPHILLNTDYIFKGTPWFDIYDLVRAGDTYINFPTYSFDYNSAKRFK